ncbi:hypothetical protein HPB48_016708 [Haemaphysalis longicornis]|uniref:Uncharacterized protein n=1 Tax=Haemaphysalis longicornis TaxID=44386 RepID=A0A9J6FSF6_HAELO|nr:hypothetical protein HPB48_016708 [Haemaphysalis longicornis]
MRANSAPPVSYFGSSAQPSPKTEVPHRPVQGLASPGPAVDALLLQHADAVVGNATAFNSVPLWEKRVSGAAKAATSKVFAALPHPAPTNPRSTRATLLSRPPVGNIQAPPDNEEEIVVINQPGSTRDSNTSRFLRRCQGEWHLFSLLVGHRLSCLNFIRINFSMSFCIANSP